jgi:hypothetical protein
VFLQRSGQQVVKAGDHGSGVVVEARCDHGVVVDLEVKDQKGLETHARLV